MLIVILSSWMLEGRMGFFLLYSGPQTHNNETSKGRLGKESDIFVSQY